MASVTAVKEKDHAVEHGMHHQPHPFHLLRQGHPLHWLRAEFERGASCSDASFWHKTAEKAIAFAGTTSVLGFADTLHLPQYFPYNKYFADFLNFLIHPSPPFDKGLVINAEYQTWLILSTVLTGIGTLWTFKEKGWKWTRNLLNAIMILPALVTMDFTSAEMTYYEQNGHFTSILPPADYTWRAGQFGNTALGAIVNVINQPSVLFPGWIFGYDLAVVAALSYIGLQTGISLYLHLTKKKMSKTIGYVGSKVRSLFKGKDGNKDADTTESGEDTEVAAVLKEIDSIGIRVVGKERWGKVEKDTKIANGLEDIDNIGIKVVGKGRWEKIKELKDKNTITANVEKVNNK